MQGEKEGLRGEEVAKFVWLMQTTVISGGACEHCCGGLEWVTEQWDEVRSGQHRTDTQCKGSTCSKVLSEALTCRVSLLSPSPLSEISQA